MALSIKDPNADRMAREVARRTGESLTEAVANALRERLQRLLQPKRSLADDLDEISQRCASLPDLDRRSAEAILGYDERGLPR
jgi:antitoxin VapB